ncbi:MAG: redox-sensing transcriptional repressor Rex [Erysipelotrichaceae bacterium]|nr:redox-sensing transcriptional repressor Rex [Erysipelotrichaceae bacterium]MDD3924894.1 redox-sensing transcriptional repressor Rex [Erysipelotrichaceae bacterium]MDD4642781.1 redox-sensing transcriptional repressor Rex [Erysipelotrichaceae bacterium]
MNDEICRNISLTSLRRLPSYLRYLKTQRDNGIDYLSSIIIAQAMELSPMVVKKDLSIAIKVEGKPKLGYHVDSLIKDIEMFLGYDNKKDAVLVGVGSLGKALLSYEGFKNYGLNIIVGFDKEVNEPAILDKKILSIDKFSNLTKRMNIHIGIITTNKEAAQEIANMMVEAGIKAIWNWAPVKLSVPEDIVVKNEDLAASLAVLSNSLSDHQIGGSI